MKITCDVIEDLLPLYVDDVASGDSRTLIEEHLNECESCRKTLENMKEGYELESVKKENSNQDDKMIILHLKKKIWKRILTAVAITAALAALVYIWNYFYYDYSVYVDYEDSGVYVENGFLYEPIDLNGEYSLLSPDQTVEFFYVVDSPFNDKRSPFADKMNNYRILMDMNAIWPDGAEAIISNKEEAEKLRKEGITDFSEMPYAPRLKQVEKLYYLAKNQKSNLNDAWDAWEKGDLQTAEKLMKEVKENSVLLWERK